MKKTRSKVTTVILFLLSAALASTADGVRAADPLDAYNVVWDTPSNDHNGSMPIGNGETGLNVWVEPSGDLVFLISRTDSWDENERLCKLGRVRVKFTPGLAGGDFRQILKLRQGDMTGIRFAGLDNSPAPVIPFPDKRRSTGE